MTTTEKEFVIHQLSMGLNNDQAQVVYDIVNSLEKRGWESSPIIEGFLEPFKVNSVGVRESVIALVREGRLLNEPDHLIQLIEGAVKQLADKQRKRECQGQE